MNSAELLPPVGIRGFPGAVLKPKALDSEERRPASVLPLAAVMRQSIEHINKFKMTTNYSVSVKLSYLVDLSGVLLSVFLLEREEISATCISFGLGFGFLMSVAE